MGHVAGEELFVGEGVEGGEEVDGAADDVDVADGDLVGEPGEEEAGEHEDGTAEHFAGGVDAAELFVGDGGLEEGVLGDVADGEGGAEEDADDDGDRDVGGLGVGEGEEADEGGIDGDDAAGIFLEPVAGSEGDEGADNHASEVGGDLITPVGAVAVEGLGGEGEEEGGGPDAVGEVFDGFHDGEGAGDGMLAEVVPAGDEGLPKG